MGIIIKKVTKMDTWRKTMSIDIRELREATGMTQKAFSNFLGIPLSTLRKWEQGESSPAPYVINLIARVLPCTDSALQKIEGNDGAVYYYDRKQKAVLDVKGNKIFIQEDIVGVKEQNLRLYLSDLFADFYHIQEKFNRDCRYDKQEDIL